MANKQLIDEAREFFTNQNKWDIECEFDFDPHVLEASADFAAHVLAREWVFVEDRLPETNDIYAVIVPAGNGKFMVTYDAYHGDGRWTHYQGHRAWLPVPPLPEAFEEESE